MKIIRIMPKWHYDGIIRFTDFDDKNLEELQNVIKDIGDSAYKQGYNDGLDAKSLGCISCAFEDVNEWEMPCAKCSRACKDYWRAKA